MCLGITKQGGFCGRGMKSIGWCAQHRGQIVWWVLGAGAALVVANLFG